MAPDRWPQVFIVATVLRVNYNLFPTVTCTQSQFSKELFLFNLQVHLVAEDECGFFWLQLGLKPLGNEQREFQSPGIQWGGYIKDTGVLTEFHFLSNRLEITICQTLSFIYSGVCRYKVKRDGLKPWRSHIQFRK